MKKTLAVMVAFVFAATLFVQAQTEKKTENKPAEHKTEAKAHHSDYVMMNGKMTHCMGEKTEAMTKDVTLKNGTVVTSKGEVKTKDGKTTMLQDGQCVDTNGKIGKFDDVHAKKEAQEKM